LSYALHQPDEGVFDVHAILQGFLGGACRQGAELRTTNQAKALVINNGRIAGIETSNGFLKTNRVLIAAGGWASELAAAAGYPITFTPHRRHLLVTEPLKQVDRRWPVVWILGDDFYFRPESAGLLMCALDAVPVTPQQGEVTDPAEVERIAVKAECWLPDLAHAGVARAWAGMRTFVSDQRFVIGPDPRLIGLYWAAGMGGHGITCAPAIGKLAGEWIAEGGSQNPASAALAPDRLLKQQK
jgi:glycine/D-amino acid oxidase-like deaminating enzyme